jgi:hypothetical protein
MFVLGVTHIVLGTFGFLASCVMLIFAGAMLVPSSFIRVDQLPLFPTVGRTGSMAVGILLLGVARAVASVTLIIAGVRVLDVSPAGRRLSLAAIYIWTFVNVFEAFALSEPLWVFLLLTAYPLIVEILFLRSRWRVAFSRVAEE